MLDPEHPLSELLRRDDRYHFDAYVFVFDALRYAQDHLDLGTPVSVDFDDLDMDEDEIAKELADELADADFDDDFDDDAADEVERHVSGQQLCEAIRQYALKQYGLLANSVLNHWGVRTTGDFGEIVFNLIDIGQMKKTDQDRREDFEDVFDLSEALTDKGVFSLTEVGEES